MTKEEATKHEKEVLRTGKKPQEVYGADVVRLVDKRRKEEQQYQQWR